MKITGSTVWLVGASGGIGEYVAYECARKGANLILSARRQEELERVASKCEALGAEVSIHTLDVTSPAQIEDVTARVLQDHTIDLLINNAGVSQRAKAGEVSLDVERRIFEINYFGLIDITKRVLTGMLEMSLPELSS